MRPFSTRLLSDPNNMRCDLCKYKRKRTVHSSRTNGWNSALRRPYNIYGYRKSDHKRPSKSTRSRYEHFQARDQFRSAQTPSGQYWFREIFYQMSMICALTENNLYDRSICVYVSTQHKCNKGKCFAKGALMKPLFLSLVPVIAVKHCWIWLHNQQLHRSYR